MAAEALITVLVCVVLVVLFTLGGMSVLKHGVNTKGAAGTLGSALGVIDPSTGAPTYAPGAAREEMKQLKHEAPSSGNGLDPATVYSGKISLPDTSGSSRP